MNYAKSNTDKDDFIQITIPRGAYELESLIDEIKRINIDEGHFTKVDFPFTIKPNFSTLGNIMGFLGQEPKISFLPNDSTRDLLAFSSTTIYEENILSHDLVDISSFGNFFSECDITQGLIFKGRRSSFIFNWTKAVDAGYKNWERFHGGIVWYMMDNKDFVSKNNFKSKNESNQLVSFNGKSITSRLSVKKAQFFLYDKYFNKTKIIF